MSPGTPPPAWQPLSPAPAQVSSGTAVATVEDAWAWALALLPLVWLLVDQALHQRGVVLPHLLRVTAAVYLGSALVAADRRRLPVAVPRGGVRLGGVGLTLVPLYLARRSSVLDRSPVLVVVSVVVLAVQMSSPWWW